MYKIIIVIMGCVVSSYSGGFYEQEIFSKTHSFGFSPALVESISNGAQIAMEHCHKIFEWNRWNCPKETFSRKYKHPATKELAFAKAIVAAGVVYSITRNCSRGDIDGCGCDPNLGDQIPIQISGKDVDSLIKNETTLKDNEKVKWSYGGCSDYVGYGDMVAKLFLDDLEPDLEPTSLTNIHNNQIGREVVQETMIRRCRCHGVSGSCTIQTCWMQVAPFLKIAEAIKEKYEKSLHFEIKAEISNFIQETNITQKIPTKSLIFLIESPDYCKPDNITNWNGTKGRKCSRTKSSNPNEKRSCRNLCRTCGFKVRRSRKSTKRRCNCKFQWCCEVKCDICIETVDEFYCQ